MIRFTAGWQWLVLFALAFVAASLSGCGGGGSAGGGTGTIPVVNPTATPTPTPTPAPTVAPDVRGIAVDDTWGQPIAGATVIVSQNTAIVGATPPPPSASPWPMATTAPDGSFDVKNVPPSTWDMNFDFIAAGYPDYPNAQWVEIFSHDGHVAYHGIYTISTSGTTSLGKIAIALPTTTDNAWLAGINHDRAYVGTPAVTTPLAFDSVTLETARYWAEEEASVGFFAHQCPSSATSCVGFWLWATEHHSLPDSQNIAFFFSDWTVAEAQFMAEQANCPGGNWQTCTSAENTGHYIDIMSASNWAGVGEATGKDPTTQTGSSTPYYVENFASPNGFGAIQSAARSLEIR